MEKQYRHYLWLHSLNDKQYIRAIKLCQTLFGVIPRGYGTNGINWE